MNIQSRVTAPVILVSIAEQRLRLITAEQQYDWPIATAANGAGELSGSGCTPRGKHRVVAAIGANQPINTVFVGRRPTGEIYSAELAKQHPQRDWILTRILWLQGLEQGKNRLGQVDTMRRYIYIHGVPDCVVMGTPKSHGCINMRNQDVIELFALVQPGIEVYIFEGSFE